MLHRAIPLPPSPILPLAKRLALFIGLACLLAAPGLRAANSGQSISAALLAPVDSPTSAIHEAPTELFEVLAIIDGDTIHIQRKGEKEKLRLLSVDTEEKITPGMFGSASKPQTVFGEETRLWTIDFFEQFRGADGKLRVGLAFPDGKEAYDVYGRLLCHVLLEDGTDFNLLLVELGKSPYFNKYGNSLICHEAFVAAQKRARRNLVGVWDPRTNEPQTEGGPSAKRPYDRLLPWWNARAQAIDAFRRLQAESAASVIAADDSAALGRALASGAELEVFGTPDRFFEEDDGSLTVLMRSSDKQNALRISVPADARAAFESFDILVLRNEFRQNYIFVRGTVTRGQRGYRMSAASPSNWRRAAGEPE